MMSLKGGNMKVLNDNELERVTGGAIGTTTLIVLIGIGVVSLVVFLSGVFNGYTNPGKCNNEGS